MTNESSSMTMKSDNESKLVNTTDSSSNNTNNNNIYYNCSSNKSTAVVATANSATPSANDLPLITLAPFSRIKRELDSGDHTRTSSSSMVTKSINNSSSNCNSQVPALNPNPSVSAKMGSRRIFTPQFKLQVLESYRNDSDCKGNQRATARKYNIHRRQIQKWLQCESNLRSSVANISANNVKHQFHNITHQMPIVTSTLPSSASSSIHTNSNHHAHHNQQYKTINNRLSLDTTRHSVALTSIPTNPTSKAATHQGVSANIGDIGAVAPLSSPSPSSTSYLSTTVKSLHAPISPILHPQILSKSSSSLSTTTTAASVQCSKGIPAVIGGPGTMAPLHTAYHHESMGIHTPPALLTSVPVSVPIITPHPHTHLHVANLKNHYHHLHMEQQQQHHHHHHHHHHPYNQVSSPPQQSSERRPFMPSASLPALPTSSSSSSSPSSSSSTTTTVAASSPPAPMTAVALSCTDTSATTPAVALSLAQAEENRIDELRDYQTAATTTLVPENRYMNENEYRTHRTFEGFHYYMPPHMHPAAAMIAPIDLSLGTKRLDYALSFRENNNDYKRATTFFETPKREPSPKDHDDDNDDSQLNVVDSDFSESSVVDLTLRKRKVLMPTPEEPETVSAQKHTKLSPEEDSDKPHEPAKTFKLFKPYLLGEESQPSDGDKETANKICKQKDPIIWSHHTCLSPPISTGSSRGSNFQSPPADAYPFPAGSPNFQPTTTTAHSASFRCPKGSPVSGYESSSSIYSDSASSSGADNHYGTVSHQTTYRFDLKVHNINGDLPNKHQLISPTTTRPFIGDGCIPLPPTHNINHVQRWLDQEPGIRQSIALYV